MNLQHLIEDVNSLLHFAYDADWHSAAGGGVLKVKGLGWSDKSQTGTIPERPKIQADELDKPFRYTTPRGCVRRGDFRDGEVRLERFAACPEADETDAVVFAGHVMIEGPIEHVLITLARLYNFDKVQIEGCSPFIADGLYRLDPDRLARVS